MDLAPGTHLGPYEIGALLGEGGMGAVYRAHDPRLNRDVAIKVAREQFNERFEREARAVAALNHPNICQLYDIGPNYLVMELVEGRNLSGPLPLADALRVAQQIASALEAAHEKGIVHRDLKPANIKVTPDGVVNVLDFGLARMGASEPTRGDASQSPTLTASQTQAGAIVGTAAYMSPEQARGQTVDKRADIWAFGVVLFEILTGKRLFQGEDLTETLASVVKDQPDFGDVPPEVRRLLRRCLEKDPKKRLRDIGDYADLLETSEASRLPSRTALSKVLLAVAAVSTLAAAWLAFLHFRPAPLPASHVARFRYELPVGQSFTRFQRHIVAISPDGAKLAYVANQQLYLRALNELDASPIRGTNEDPIEPVFSPDGQWLAYFVPPVGSQKGTALKKIAVTGGPPVTLATPVPFPLGAAWDKGMIAFGSTSQEATILAVPETGGPIRTLVNGGRKKERLGFPRFLADGEHLLFVSLMPGSNRGQIVVEPLNGKGDRKTLVADGNDPHLLPGGRLAYLHEGTLLAAPFDANGLTVTGPSVPFAEDVMQSLSGQFDISSDGTLVYAPGAYGEEARYTLVWVDPQGHETPISAKPRAYAYPRLSSDGSKIAVNSQEDMWVFDFAKETLTRLTAGSAYQYHPVWTADDKFLYFSSGPNPNSRDTDVVRKAADGTGPVEALTQQLQGGSPQTLSPDGKSLIFRKATAPSTLFLLLLTPPGEPRGLIPDIKSSQYDAEISPDGKWLAYDSDESGRREVFVRPFPAVQSGRWQVSADGGRFPAWARSERELFFVNGANRMVAVPVQTGAGFVSGKPETLFDANPYQIRLPSRSFDISADGKRFLMVKTSATDNPKERPSIVVVSHWFDEVAAKIPARR